MLVFRLATFSSLRFLVANTMAPSFCYGGSLFTENTDIGLHGLVLADESTIQLIEQLHGGACQFRRSPWPFLKAHR